MNIIAHALLMGRKWSSWEHLLALAQNNLGKQHRSSLWNFPHFSFAYDLPSDLAATLRCYLSVTGPVLLPSFPAIWLSSYKGIIICFFLLPTAQCLPTLCFSELPGQTVSVVAKRHLSPSRLCFSFTFGRSKLLTLTQDFISTQLEYFPSQKEKKEVMQFTPPCQALVRLARIKYSYGN